MANQNSGYLGNNNTGPDLRDWQHAARMFTDNNQIYGPKQNFLFHVAISINPERAASPRDQIEQAPLYAVHPAGVPD